MPAPPTAHATAIRQILADGSWHTRDELIAKAGVLIPPGRAMRARDKDLKRLQDKSRAAGKLPGGKPVRSHDYQIAVGRKRIIVDTINSLVGIEHKIENGIRWVRSARPTTKESHHQ